MKKLLNVFAIVAIASISIISCKKEGMTTSSRDNVKNTPSFLYREGGALDPSNSENPYDTIGSKHNEYCIAYFTSFYNLDDSNTLGDFNILKNYFHLSDGSANYWAEVNIANRAAIINGNSNYHQDVLDAFEITPEFEELNDDIKAIVSNTSLNLEEKINAVRAIENNPPSLNSENLKIFYGVTSITRYSLFLWSNIEDGGYGLYNEVCARPFNDDGRVVLSDAVGFYAGAIGGPASALSGMVGASAWTAISDYLDW